MTSNKSAENMNYLKRFGLNDRCCMNMMNNCRLCIQTQWMSQSHFNYLSSTLSGKVASYCFDLFIFFFPITCKHSYAFRLFNTFQVSAMFEVPHCACECFEIFYRNSSNTEEGRFRMSTYAGHESIVFFCHYQQFWFILGN